MTSTSELESVKKCSWVRSFWEWRGQLQVSLLTAAVKCLYDLGGALKERLFASLTARYVARKRKHTVCHHPSREQHVEHLNVGRACSM